MIFLSTYILQLVGSCRRRPLHTGHWSPVDGCDSLSAEDCWDCLGDICCHSTLSDIVFPWMNSVNDSSEGLTQLITVFRVQLKEFYLPCAAHDSLGFFFSQMLIGVKWHMTAQLNFNFRYFSFQLLSNFNNLSASHTKHITIWVIFKRIKPWIWSQQKYQMSKRTLKIGTVLFALCKLVLFVFNCCNFRTSWVAVWVRLSFKRGYASQQGSPG